MPQMRRRRNDPKTRARLWTRWCGVAVWAFDGVRRGGGKPRQEPDRQELYRPEHDKHGGSTHSGGHSLRYQGAQETAHGAGAGNLPEASFRLYAARIAR